MVKIPENVRCQKYFLFVYISSLFARPILLQFKLLRNYLIKCCKSDPPIYYKFESNQENLSLKDKPS